MRDKEDQKPPSYRTVVAAGTRTYRTESNCQVLLQPSFPKTSTNPRNYHFSNLLHWHHFLGEGAFQCYLMKNFINYNRVPVEEIVEEDSTSYPKSHHPSGSTLTWYSPAAQQHNEHVLSMSLDFSPGLHQIPFSCTKDKPTLSFGK